MKTMTKKEFEEKTSGMTKDEKVTIADELGRLQVTFDIRKRHPEYKIVSMPIHSKYDLEVYDEKDNLLYYIEVKDRWDYKLKDLKTVFLNIPKYKDAQYIKDKWLYANIFQDKEIVYFKPYEMPETGITYGTYPIKKMTVDGEERIPQKRMELNLNDKLLQRPNKLDITLLT